LRLRLDDTTDGEFLIDSAVLFQSLAEAVKKARLPITRIVRGVFKRFWCPAQSARAGQCKEIRYARRPNTRIVQMKLAILKSVQAGIPCRPTGI